MQGKRGSNTCISTCIDKEMVGWAMVLGNCQCWGILLIGTIVEGGPTLLAGGWSCLDILSLSLSLSLGLCLSGTLSLSLGDGPI